MRSPRGCCHAHGAGACRLSLAGAALAGDEAALAAFQQPHVLLCRLSQRIDMRLGAQPALRVVQGSVVLAVQRHRLVRIHRQEHIPDEGVDRVLLVPLVHRLDQQVLGEVVQLRPWQSVRGREARGGGEALRCSDPPPPGCPRAPPQTL